ncbi:autotransporter domain-containing protein [Campylobacter felis]|uniref:autotransporter domain-containing protein n=1 Tax=Campylobacter TaxID=194 RepID=UPI0022EA9A3D|nr:MULTISPECIES: autotransporter domain-containing protein [Campylobacter]MDL0110254.1 autotransporter domain-containing protein [Campylobacter felis]
MKKTLSIICFCAINSYADYTSKFPSTSITLTQDETHKAEAACYHQQCAFNYNGSNGGYDLSITGKHTLTITRQDPSGGITTHNKDIPIYFQNLSQNQATFDIRGFDSFIGQSINLTNKSSLIFTGTNKQNNSFSTHGDIDIDNSKLTIKNTASFTTSGKFSAKNNSVVDIGTQVTFSQDALIENSTFSANSLTIQGLNKSVLGDELGLATVTNKNGTIHIKGDVYNGFFKGGNNNPDICAQMGTCGNGKIVNEGGSITIEGKLTNESFDDNKNNTNSSLSIQGGSVVVKGGMENKINSTIEFTQSGGTFGKLEVGGSGLQNNGEIKADITGINQQGNLQLITGNISGNTNIAINGGSNMTQTLSCPDGSIIVGMQGQTLTCPSTGGGGSSGGGGSGGGSNPPAKVEQLEKLVYGNSASANGRALLRSLALGDIVGISTTKFRKAKAIKNFFAVSSYNADIMRGILDDTDKGIRMSYLSLPHTSLDAMRDRELLSFNKDYEPYEFSTFASGFLGEGKGYTFGFHINHYKEVYEHLLRFELDYGYSSLHKRDDYHKASSKGDLFGVGISQHYEFDDRLSTNNRIYLGVGLFDTSRTMIFPAFNLNSTGDYNFYQLSMQNLLNYNYVYNNTLNIKPYVGLEHFYNHRSKIAENGNAVPLESESLNAYNLDVVGGVEFSTYFEKNYLKLNTGLQGAIINTEDYQHFLAGTTKEPLRYKAPYTYKFFINTGSYFYLTPYSVVGLEGFYKNSFNKDEVGYFGGNLVFKLVF